MPSGGTKTATTHHNLNAKGADHENNLYMVRTQELTRFSILSKMWTSTEMKLCRKYMKGAEFAARQAWLPFVDAVGIVLQVLEPVKKAGWEWFKKWKKGFRSPAPKAKKPQQLELFWWADGDQLLLV